MKRYACIVFLITVFLSPISAADIIHIPADQPTIQAGIDAAVDFDTVLVADGTYAGEGNREISFGGKAVTLASANGREHCIINCGGLRGFELDSGEGQLTVIQGFTIVGGYTVWDGGAIYCGGDASPVIRDNAFVGNSAPGGAGGAVACRNTTQVIGNYFSGNYSDDLGGALYLGSGSQLVMNNVFVDNAVLLSGGAIGSWDSTATIINNLIVANHQQFQWNDLGGGGIACYTGSSHEIINCTIADNDAEWLGGGIYVDYYSEITCMNCILWNNTSTMGLDQINGQGGATVIVEHSDVMGGWAGTGNLDLAPLFAGAPDLEYYLSQVAAGQAVDSPCVDVGDPSTSLIDGTTRTDLVPDTGIVDIGFHYPFAVPRIRLVTGPGPGYDNAPLVGVYDLNDITTPEYEFSAYGPHHYGTNVACGDVDGDTIDEILTGAGPGDIYGPHVRGFTRDGGTVHLLNFIAYGTNKYGVNVAAGDLDGDGTDEIITGAGPGAVFGPHVRGWMYDVYAGVTPFPGVSYFAYGTPKWGVNVAAGDIDGDGYDEIITGAGPGAVYGPHVRGWNVDGGAVAAIPTLSFLAYGTNKFGVNVSCGDVDGDGIDEIVTGAGPGAFFGPHVRGWDYDGSAVTPLPFYSFIAWESDGIKFGVNVSVMPDLDLDGRQDLATGRGPDPEADTWIKIFTYDGTSVNGWLSLEAFPGYVHGANVAAALF